MLCTAFQNVTKSDMVVQAKPIKYEHGFEVYSLWTRKCYLFQNLAFSITNKRQGEEEEKAREEEEVGRRRTNKGHGHMQHDSCSQWIPQDKAIKKFPV